MSKTEILAASFFFPPMASPRSIQVSRLLSGLDATIAVVCGDDPLLRRDATICPDAEKVFHEIVRFPFRRNRLLRYAEYLADRARISWSNIPDEKLAWALRAGRELINRELPDVLITFGQPMSDHLLGARYVKKLRMPWIAHFSDPWSDNPFRRDNPLAAAANRRLEASVIEAADALIFTSQETIDIVMRKYPEELRAKAFLLPHCYDPAAYENVKNSEGYVIRSVGDFYGVRTPEPLYRALQNIARKSPALLENVSVEIVGYIESRLKGMIGNYPLARKYVRFTSPVPYAESLRRMRGANCLLVVDAPAETSPFFPSKLVDYIGAGRFLLAVTPPGTAERIVKESGGIVADPRNDEAVTAALERVLRERPESSPVQLTRYDKKIVCGEMMRIIDAVLSGQTPPSAAS